MLGSRGKVASSSVLDASGQLHARNSFGQARFTRNPPRAEAHPAETAARSETEYLCSVGSRSSCDDAPAYALSSLLESASGSGADACDCGARSVQRHGLGFLWAGISLRNYLLERATRAANRWATASRAVARRGRHGSRVSIARAFQRALALMWPLPLVALSSFALEKLDPDLMHLQRGLWWRWRSALWRSDGT